MSPSQLGEIPHPYSSYGATEPQRNVNPGQERLSTLKSVIEKNEILPPAPAPHPKSQGTRKPRATLYNAGKLTIKISRDTVLTFSCELGITEAGSGPGLGGFPPLKHPRPSTAAASSVAHLGS